MVTRVKLNRPERSTPGDRVLAAESPEKEGDRRLALQGEMAWADPGRLFGKWNGGAYNPSLLVSRQGMGVFDRMRRDDQVKACLKFKKMAILSTGWEIKLPPDQNDPEWEPVRFLRTQLADIGAETNSAGSFRAGLLSVLTALDYGFSVSEKLFVEIKSGEFAGKIGFSALKGKKPHGFRFDVNEFGTLKPDGLVQETPKGQLKLPVSKFLIMSNDMEFGNWYGTSDLEAAYRSWWVKDNALKWLAMLLERFGVPPIFALFDPNKMTDQQISMLISVVEKIQAATAGAIPRSSKDSLEMWSPQLAGQTGTVFIPAIDMFNRDIARALLMPGLLGMTPDASVGSMARARVHFDAFMMVVEHLRLMLTDLIQDQIVGPLIDLNYPAISHPRFSFLPFSDDVMLDLIKVWADLVGGQVVKSGAEDEKHIRSLLKFPEPDKIDPPDPDEDPDQSPDEDPDQSPGEDAPQKPPGSPESAPDPAQGPGVGAKSAPLLGRPGKPQVKVGPSIKPHNEAGFSREPNGFERAVDFAAMRRDLDGLENRAVTKIVEALEESREAIFELIRGKFDGGIAFVNRINHLKRAERVRQAFVEAMQTATMKGEAAVRSELSKSKDMATKSPNKSQSAAAQYLKKKADFFVSGINKALVEKTRQVLVQVIDAGESIPQAIERLQATFEPYTGNRRVIRDGDVIKPHRLETIIRTNLTDAYTRGRLLESQDAGELVHGYEFSAILDERTTEICRFMDGRVFKPNDPELERLKPPLHHNCRSTLVPVTVDVPIDEEDFLTSKDTVKARGMIGEDFGGEPGQTGGGSRPSTKEAREIMRGILKRIEAGEEVDPEIIGQARDFLKKNAEDHPGN